MKRKSPSHPSEKQFLQRVSLYHASNFPFFWKVKAGIGFKPESRLKDVSVTTSGYVWPTATVSQMEFGKAFETFIHWFYALLNRPFKKGSGRSEWFLNLNPIVGGGLTFLAWREGVAFEFSWWQYALVWSFPFLWLDYLLWMLFFSLLRVIFWGIVIAAFIGLIFALLL